MMLKAGSILKSTAQQNDTFFEGAYIIVVEYNENGAIGFTFNKRFGRSLHHLEAFRHVPPFTLYNGGPVDVEHLYFIHQRPDIIDDGVQIDDRMYWGGNFNQAVHGIKTGQLTKSDLKIFVGYCGWEKGDVEGEIEENSWSLVKEKTDVFADY